jgi:glycosyltransferase involved in cell wall biosynthesis
MKRTLLVIPHYNDTGRLTPFLSELGTHLSSHFSVLVSDDGSLESERESLRLICETSRKNASVKGPQILPPLFTQANTGKGGAIIRGWEQGEGFEQLAFVDADGAVGPSEIIRAEQYFRGASIDALFGSRVKMLGRSISRSRARHYSGRIFATLVSTLLTVPAYDTQCGLKIITLGAYQKIRNSFKSCGFAFDVELLIRLIDARCPVEEFPIDWHDVQGSKVSLVRDSFLMAREVFKIRGRRQNELAQNHESMS